MAKKTFYVFNEQFSMKWHFSERREKKFMPMETKTKNEEEKKSFMSLNYIFQSIRMFYFFFFCSPTSNHHHHVVNVMKILCSCVNVHYFGRRYEIHASIQIYMYIHNAWNGLNFFLFSFFHPSFLLPHTSSFSLYNILNFCANVEGRKI
jgi:hypothetical protein